MKKLTILLFISVLTTFLHGAPASLDALEALKNVKADKWEVVGSNYVVSGNVRICYKDMVLTCDRAVVNPGLQDFEAGGNCRLVREGRVADYPVLCFECE